MLKCIRVITKIDHMLGHETSHSTLQMAELLKVCYKRQVPTFQHKAYYLSICIHTYPYIYI